MEECGGCAKAEEAKRAEKRKKTYGLLSFVKAKLSGRVSKELAAERFAICESCQERNTDTNELLFRKIDGKSFCGVPRLADMLRDERATGCGCELEDKVTYKASECPRQKWLEEGMAGAEGIIEVDGNEVKGHQPIPAPKQFDARISTLVQLDANGIGDLCVAMTVVAGRKKAFPDQPVVLGIRPHLAAWTSLFVDQDFTVLNEGGEGIPWKKVCYPNQGKMEHEWVTRGKESWPENSCKKCDVAPAIPRVYINDEGRDFISKATAFGGKKTVVIAPYAVYMNRNWPLHRWLQLEKKFQDAGVTVISSDGPGDGSKLAIFSGIKYWGHGPHQTAALLQKADLIIGNDSGLAHLAGVLQRPAIAIHGPTNGWATYGVYGTVKWIESDLDCHACYWQEKNGYAHPCTAGCDALHSIPVDKVFKTAMEMLGL